MSPDSDPSPSATGVTMTAAAVVSAGRVLRPGWLQVSAGRVVGAGAGAPPVPMNLNLGTALVVPGFVDLHVHGGGGGSFTTGRVADAEKAAAYHRRHGTTTMLASLVTAAPDVLARQVAGLAGLAEDGLIAGVHLEGPWLSARRCGAHPVEHLRDPETGEVERLLRAGRGQLRLITFAPERAGALAAIRRVVDGGVIAAIGHTDAAYEVTRAAVEAGASLATHLFNAMRPVHHREPGPVPALLEDARVTVEIVLDGVHLHPAIYRQVLASAGSGRVALVTDAMAAAGMPDGTYTLGSSVVSVQDGVARLAGQDTIAGSTATTAGLFRRAVAEGRSSGDAALLDAVRQTSEVPARVLGLAGHRLAVGDAADLVVLDAELTVAGVMAAGEWVSRS